MYRIPETPESHEEFTFPAGAKELWLRALERPEVDLKCQAAHAIATAHRDGVAGFETTIPALRAEFDRPDLHPAARLALADALIALEARPAGESFLRQAQSGGSDLRELVEPALARWDHRPAREVWLARLRDPTTSSSSLALAIRCLADVRDEQAVEPLRALVLSERSSGQIRLRAAHALAALRGDGLETDAERLSADASRRGLTARRCAAELLRQHRGEKVVALLQRLARDADPVVAAPAAARLLELDPALLDAWVDYLFGKADASARGDANLRRLAVEALYRRPSAEHLRLLSARMDDEHSGVRIAARDYLGELAGDRAWREQIIQDASVLLSKDRWRGQEEAAILLAQLDHKAAAGRLVKLLSSDRPEVAVTAAWALRQLAVMDSLPGVVKYIESRTTELLSADPSTDRGKFDRLMLANHQLSQLLQLVGQQKYRSAEPLLHRYIPKPKMPDVNAEARAAAIYALGLIHEQKGPPEDLVTTLEKRLNDITSLPPESMNVRWMVVVAFGRWKARQTIPSLRRAYSDGRVSQDPVNNASGWALGQMTGEVMPPARPVRKARRGWFLVPQGK